MLKETCRRDLSRPKETCRRNVYLCQKRPISPERDLYNRPCVSAKEPYISAKEPNISAKEPNISAKEICTTDQFRLVHIRHNGQLQKRPTYPRKNQTYLQRSPTYPQKSPQYLQKRSVQQTHQAFCTFVIIDCKRALYVRKLPVSILKSAKFARQKAQYIKKAKHVRPKAQYIRKRAVYISPFSVHRERSL